MIVVLVNPAAGKGAAGRAIPAIERLLAERDAEYEVRRTKAPGELCAAARAAALEGARLVAAVGGDGSVHEVANGLLQAAAAGHRAALGIVPLGSGNDFARALGVPTEIEAVCDRLSSGSSRRVDAGRISRLEGPDVLDIRETGHEFFVNGLGAGFTAAVVLEAMALRRLTGLPLYITALLRAVALRYRTPGVNMSVDGAQTSMPVSTVDVLNGQWEGGGFWMAPSAQPDDGQLDLVAIKAARRLPFLRVVGRILKGTHAGSPLAYIAPVRQLTIEFDEPVPVQADGEIVARAATRIDLEVVPGVLTVAV